MRVERDIVMGSLDGTFRSLAYIPKATGSQYRVLSGEELSIRRSLG